MDHAKALSAVQSLQKQNLTIIKLAEPVLSSAQTPSDTTKRDSAGSNHASENPTPASLAADLAHYRELFSKLRFSYLEQVTKEKFLRAIVGDPPLIVEAADNVRLEKELAVSKASLKAQKEDVNAMAAELEAIGRDLSSRYEIVQLQTEQLATLPSEIARLEKTIAKAKDQQGLQDQSNASQNLSLPATMALLQERDAEADDLDAQIRALQSALPKKRRELERLESELRPLEMEKQNAISAAKDALRRKEQGTKGAGDDLEIKGRWYSGVDKVMSSVLGVET